MTDSTHEQGNQLPEETQSTQRRETTQFLAQTVSDALVSTSSKIENIKSTVKDEAIPDDPETYESVQLTSEYTTPTMSLYDRTDLDGSRELLMFHSEVSTNADNRIRRHFTSQGIQTPRGQDWNSAVVTAATTTSYRHGRFNESVKDPSRRWRQTLETASGPIGLSAPALKENVLSYSGEKAMLRVRAMLGMGGIISVPLYHSGLWVTMTAPSEGAVIELRRRLVQEKVNLGRETFGLVFSNEQSYLNSWLLDFCLNHLYDTTVRMDNPQLELRDLIKTQDLNLLFWGMACLIWPKGFDYVRPLTTASGVENYESISAKINITKLLWVDNSSFNETAMAHMARRARSSVPVDDVLRYQQNFLPSVSSGREVKINDSVSLIISSPSAEKYINDGDVWISNIIRTVDDTFTTVTPDEASRSAIIDQHARASRLRSYGSWVKAIVADGQELTDQELIYGSLEAMSQNDEYSEIIQKAIAAYIDDSTRAIIAIPATNGKETAVPRFANLIPVDVINAFFTLLAQRVNIISRR